MSFLAGGAAEHPFTEALVGELRTALQAHCTTHGSPCKLDIAPGQPFCLDLLRACLQLLGDLDVGLPALLEEGVPTGCCEPIACSGVWVPKACAEDSLGCYSDCVGNWASADTDPSLTAALVQEDVAQGFVVPFAGDRAAAHRKWPGKTAIGKLGVVVADGRKPRLVLDSTAPGVNPS